MPSDKTAYTKLTNEELKREVRDFVVVLRTFHRESEAAKPNYLNQHLEELRAAKSDEEKKEIQSRYFNLEYQEQQRWRSERAEKYDKQFKTKAIILNEEMLRRLPRDEVQRIGIAATYDLLLLPSPIEWVAADLERLSKLVP